MKILLMVTLLVMVTAPFWAIPLKRSIERSLVRNLEDRTFDRGKTTSRSTRSAHPGPVIFPVATAFCVLPLIAAVVLRSTVEPHTLANVFRALIHPTVDVVVWSAFHATVVAAVFAAFCLHVLGAAARRWKYDIVLTAVLSFVLYPSMGSTIDAAFKTAGPGLFVEANAQSAIDQAAGIGLVWWCGFVLAQLMVYFLIARMLSFGRATRIYYWLQLRSMWVIALALPPVLVLYTLIRYHVVGVLELRPILYFRSFRYAGAPTAFANVVVKACRRFGIVEGLTHPTQRSSDLQGKLDLFEQAHFAVVAEGTWQTWVAERLQAASLVLIDASYRTDNVSWEIDQAVAALPRDRVGVIAAEGTKLMLPEDVWRVYYTTDSTGLRRCQAELTAWLRSRLLPKAELRAAATQAA